MRNGTPAIASLGRSLAMLEAILADRDARSIAALARDLDVPVATAHRQVTTLVAEAYLVRLPGGRFGPGPRLLALLQLVDEKQVIATAAAPVLHRLAARLRCVVQLGTLENDMVTYRIKTGRGAGDLFTKVGLQLEAYCSGIGKVLLAHLPEAEREAYLSTGPFPALTTHTITEPDRLREELVKVRLQGFAQDREEVAEDLFCLAVPIRSATDYPLAAISVSRTSAARASQSEARVLAMLKDAASDISCQLMPQIGKTA